MTRYEIPSRPSPGNSVTSTDNNSQSKINSSDLESRMARLVGFEEEPEFAEEDSVTFKEPAISEPEQVKTEQPLSSNPFAKVGLVGAGTFALVVFAGVFLTQIMSGNHNKPKNNTVTPKIQPSPASEPRLQQQGEIEALKTKLALEEQARDIKAAQQQLRSEKPLPPRTQQPVSSREKPTPVRTVYVPRTVTVARPLPQPEVKNTPTVQAANVEPLPTVTPPAAPDPLQKWSMLAKLGSYGQVPASSKPSASYSVATNNASLEVRRPPIRIVQNPNSAPMVSQATQTSQSSKLVKVGTSAKGFLVTAIYGESTNTPSYQNNQKNGNSQSINNQVFLVELTEPLKAADGSIALPEKTKLLTKIRSISDKGLVQLDLVKATWQEKNGNTIEKSLSPDAITIRGPQSQPLVASQYQKGRSHITSDAKLFILGGAGKIGDVINLPNSKLVTLKSCSKVEGSTQEDCTRSEAIQSEPQRNTLAAALDGGTKSILPELTRRNQQANSNSTERTNIWYLPARTKIELFVNQQTQF